MKIKVFKHGLRTHLTNLREDAFLEIKPSYTDTGAAPDRDTCALAFEVLERGMPVGAVLQRDVTPLVIDVEGGDDHDRVGHH